MARSSRGWSSPFQCSIAAASTCLLGVLIVTSFAACAGDARASDEHDRECESHRHESSFEPVAAEADVQRIGRELAAALPARGRNPIKALDDRAMELASRDAELRAALFRLVDVTPACRSLDDLARHLGEYLAEVDERTPSLQAAMRAADSRAGRKALGAAAAAGVRHMAHRFIVGESPKAALRTLRVAARRRRAHDGRPARRGHRHRGGGGPLRRPLRRGARDARGARCPPGRARPSRTCR